MQIRIKRFTNFLGIYEGDTTEYGEVVEHEDQITKPGVDSYSFRANPHLPEGSRIKYPS